MLLDLLFPSFCVGCQKEGSFLCEECENKIVIRRIPTSPPLNAKSLNIIYAATEYQDKLIAELITQLKYQSVREISHILSDFLLIHLAFAGFKKENNQIIVPVPLHRKRLRERGFNQSELIANNISKKLDIPVSPRALKRIKNTEHQTKIEERENRLENVKDVFICKKPEIIKGKVVILIDDVTTTGATLNECAKILKLSDAKKVLAFTVAK